MFILCLIHKISPVSESEDVNDITGAGISFLHRNSYFLTGVLGLVHMDTYYNVPAFTDIKYHVQWIRGILNKHVRKYVYFWASIYCFGIAFIDNSSSKFIYLRKNVDTFLTFKDLTDHSEFMRFTNCRRSCIFL